MTREPGGGILLLCYGNPGRLDDGLGPAFGGAMEQLAPPGVDVETDYQLTVEDIKTAADHNVVIFVDAAVTGDSPFFFKSVHPRTALSFSSHSLEPEQVLGLAGQLFGRSPAGYALGIRGYEFNDFGEKLSPAAQANLEAALQFLLTVLEHGDFARASAVLTPGGGGHGAGNGDYDARW
jgi:hydrogenase maturation protease